MYFRTVTPKNLDQTCKDLGLDLTDGCVTIGKEMAEHNNFYIIEMETVRRKVLELTEVRRQQVQEAMDQKYPDHTFQIVMVNSMNYTLGPYELKQVAQ